MFPGSPPHPNVTEEEVGQPLFLTPYLESGKILEAQDLSRVRGLPTNIPSYSGFLTTNKNYDSNIFFWYIPSTVRLITYDRYAFFCILVPLE